MSLKEKREKWVLLITAALAAGEALTKTEEQLFVQKAENMSEAELDGDIAKLESGAAELARQV